MVFFIYFIVIKYNEKQETFLNVEHPQQCKIYFKYKIKQKGLD